MLRKSFVCIGMWIMLMGALVVPQSLYAQCITPPSGMVDWWPLDETSGSTANDIAGYANDGTWMNSPTPVTGKVAGALSFSGSNSVDVPDHSELNFGTGDFSIDLWIKTTASGTRTILDKRTGSVPNLTGYVLFLVNGYLSSQISDGAGYNNCVSTGFVADGNWHHVAVTVDRDNPSGWLHYVDGSAVGTPANPTGYQGSLTNTAPFVMARNLISPSNTFTGTLDEVELFNRVLDSLEVRSIWAADSLGKCKCHADGDANGDGVGLTTADTTYLAGFINGCGPAPVPLYSCDLNGDGYVNSADLWLYRAFFIFGISVFDPYGGYPVLCPCDPIPAPVPDTVNIFGLEHTSAGVACLEVVDDTLKITRLGSAGADGVEIDLENKYNTWNCIIEYPDLDDTLPVGASLEVDVTGVVDGTPDQYIGSMLQTKIGSLEWQLSARSESDTYTLEGYLGDSLVFRVENVTGTSGEWVDVGTISLQSKVNCDRGDWHVEHDIWGNSWLEHTWNGSVDFFYDSLSSIDRFQWMPSVNNPRHTELSDVIMKVADIPSIKIFSEGYTIDYGGISVTPLGNAIVTLVDTTLVVSNIGPGCYDGADAEHDSKDGDWAIVVANPDPSGTFPVGASLETEFFFATPSQPDSFSMAISMTKAALNTWNLAVQSDASICSVKAFNNGSPVFSGVDNGTTGLGYIVESAKGVYPTGFKGSSTGKPASIVVSSGHDFTASPNGVQWTWPAHGVSDLQIDYLSVSTEVLDTSLFGVTHTTMCGDNGAKTDPISFTILDIEVTPPFMRGDANGDGVINVTDVVYLINYRFLVPPGPAPQPLAAGDANCDGVVNITDVVYLINFLFLVPPGPPPGC